MMGLQIIIPTYKRSHTLPGLNYFKTAKYVVADSQKNDYLVNVPEGRMIIMPDEFEGNISKKRNWILKNISRPILVIDDDVSGLKMCEGFKKKDGEIIGTESITLTPEQADDFIISGFNLAHEFKCRIWGINVNSDHGVYRQYSPFSLSNIVLGPFTGHLEHNFYYDERLPYKEDYDINLQVLNRDRKILRINKFSYICKHGDNQGGVVSHRTMQKEIDNCRAIEKKWGRNIIKYPLEIKKRTDILNGKVSIPIKGA